MTIYELLGLNEEALLEINISIDKILKNSREKKSKRDLINELLYVNKIILRYSHKANNDTQIYTNGYLESPEFQLIEITVEKAWVIPVIAQVIQECIPYPILFVFILHERYKLGGCKVKQNQKYGELIAEDFLFSRWIYQEELSPEISECNFISINTDIFHKTTSLNEIVENFIDVCYYITHPLSDRVYCLREVMDIFKLIEYESGKLEFEPFLKRQMLHGNFEILDDTITFINFPNELCQFEDEHYYGYLGEFDGKRFLYNKGSDIELTSFDELKDMENYALQWERDDNFEYDPVMRMIGGEG